MRIDGLEDALRGDWVLSDPRLGDPREPFEENCNRRSRHDHERDVHEGDPESRAGSEQEPSNQVTREGNGPQQRIERFAADFGNQE